LMRIPPGKNKDLKEVGEIPRMPQFGPESDID
jgi:hypothetical protein